MPKLLSTAHHQRVSAPTLFSTKFDGLATKSNALCSNGDGVRVGGLAFGKEHYRYPLTHRQSKSGAASWEVMEARRLLDAAPFAPDIVELLKQVFDDAWASVAPTTAAHRAGITRRS